MKKSVLLSVLFFGLCSWGALAQQKSLVNLRTSYQQNPLGIESRPYFSWEMKADGQYSASQKSYRINVAEGLENLKSNKFVFTTGEQAGKGQSVCIPMGTSDLKPCTRYYWQVIVKDEKGKEIVSQSPAWFETGLMGTGFGDAKWIGSQSSAHTKYAGFSKLEMDFQIAPKSKETGVIFGWIDKDNYQLVQIDGTDPLHPRVIVKAVYQGVQSEYLREELTDLLGDKKINDKHHLVLDLQASNHFDYYNLGLQLDGKKLNAGKKVKVDPGDKDDSYKYARLYGIGFLQPKGQNATFTNVVIKDQLHNDNVMLKYDKTYEMKGSGEPYVWEPNAEVAAPMVRKEFSLDKPVRSARIYATARGVYDLMLNGKAVAPEQYLNPGWPDFRHRQIYNTFDITPFLVQGKNAVGATIGKGWYAGNWGYHSNWGNPYGDEISFLAKLVVTFTDGSQKTVATDASWKYTDDGPVLENGMLDGEDYDACREIQGWSEASFDDNSWRNVKIYPELAAGVEIQSYIGAPVHIDKTMTALKVTEPVKGHFVYDFGQNMAGIPQIKLVGKKGQKITVRYAEMLYPEVIPTEPVAPYTIEMYKEKQGQMYVDNYRGALSTDNYTLKGDAEGETFEPRFTSHGYRYLEITGIDAAVPVEDVKTLVLNSLQENTADYKCSDKLVNQLYSNIVWGQIGNFQAVPTDCPQRDERCGWTGDAQIFTRTSTYNRNVMPFFDRWLYSLRDAQSEDGNYGKYVPLWKSNWDEYKNGCHGWADVGIITPWQLYQQYGNKAILQQSYESMKRYMDFVAKRADGFIQPIGGYGDWVALKGTPSDFTNTVYSAYDAQIMGKVAGVLGYGDDAQRYENLYNSIKDAFNKKFVREDGWMKWLKGQPASQDSYAAAYGTGPKRQSDTIMDTQTAYIMPLFVGLLEGTAKTQAVEHLVELLQRNNYCLTTGFIGTPYMNLALSENGRDDVAYKMFQQTEFASWLYPVVQGATTIWERWNSYTLKNGFGPVSMNSFNHYSYGAVEDWMMAYSAGIQRDENQPAYKHILLQPRVGGKMSFVQARFNSVYGEIKSRWALQNASDSLDAQGKAYTYEATVPANTTATLNLQVPAGKKAKVLEGKQGIQKKLKGEGKMIFEFGSGTYKFCVE